MTIIPRGLEKRLHLRVENEGLSLFLGALFAEWHYTVSFEPPHDPEALVLADENCAANAHGNTVRLTHSTFSGRDRVCLPIVLENLWTTLETHFHRPPRNHLRLTADYPVTMEIRGESVPGQIASISPAGARLPLPRELAVGEAFAITLPLPRHVLRLQGRVIYVTTFPDSRNHYDTGVLFERIDAASRQILRDTITLAFLKSIRLKVPGWAFEVGLGYLSLSPAVREEL